MTIVSYHRFLRIFFIVFIPITLLAQFGEYIEYIKNPLFWYFILYANSILSITLLYFGIYARISGIKKDFKSDGPVLYIVVGCLLVLLSFGCPIGASFLVRDIHPIQSSPEILQKMKQGATDLKVQPKERASLARMYYLEEGERIEFINENNNKSVYSPDKATADRYERTVQMYRKNQQMNSLVRLHAKAHGLILLLSVPLFLHFIKFKKRSSESN